MKIFKLKYGNKIDSESIETTYLLKVVYPVGSIYMSVNSTSPATLFGGTWEQIKDRFLLAYGDTYENGETGAEATHTLTIAEIPPHFHSCKTYSGNNVDGKQWSIKSINNSSEGGISTDNVGGGQPHNNMHLILPYICGKELHNSLLLNLLVFYSNRSRELLWIFNLYSTRKKQI